MRIATVSIIFSVCSLTTLAASLGRDAAKPEQMVQDGILLDVHGQEKIKYAAIDIKPVDIKRIIVDNLEVPVLGSFLDNGNPCEDVASEHTGFDVNDENGFVKHANCEDLGPHCHDADIGEQVRVSCPVSCFICTPGTNNKEDSWHGPCFDATNSGIRFKDGPKASCSDLINYCNHTSIGAQVKEACKLSCGLCEIHVEGPYSDNFGDCVDLETHQEPEFTVSGQLAGCSDVAQFCTSHPDSYLIRHKCPLTCGVCGNPTPSPPPPEAHDVQIPGDTGGCNRRRRYGFCSTRRRRNI